MERSRGNQSLDRSGHDALFHSNVLADGIFPRGRTKLGFWIMFDSIELSDFLVPEIVAIIGGFVSLALHT